MKKKKKKKRSKRELDNNNCLPPCIQPFASLPNSEEIQAIEEKKREREREKIEWENLVRKKQEVKEKEK